jgi:Tyrosine phosphatase family
MPQFHSEFNEFRTCPPIWEGLGSEILEFLPRGGANRVTRPKKRISKPNKLAFGRLLADERQSGTLILPTLPRGQTLMGYYAHGPRTPMRAHELRCVAALLSLVVIASFADAQKNPVSGERPLIHPAPGTSIVRFAQVDVGLYKGSNPKTDADYRFLRSKNIKYILDLKFFPWLYRLEKRKAKKHDMIVIPATINASPIAPSEKHLHPILCMLADTRLRPLYFHCSVGRDRTSLIATLYEVNHLGLPAEDAWEEMKRFGFKDDWTLGGLKAYLQNHLSSTSKVNDGACDAIPIPTAK